MIDEERLQLAMDERQLTSHTDTQSTHTTSLRTLTDSTHLTCYALGMLTAYRCSCSYD